MRRLQVQVRVERSLQPQTISRMLRIIVALLLVALPSIILQEATASSCPVLLNGGVCPVNVAEGAPQGTLPSTCSSKGTCVRGACNCKPGWAGVDCSQVLRRLKFGAGFITQAAVDDGPTRYVDIIARTFTKMKASNLEIPPFQQKDCLTAIMKTPLVPNWQISMDLDYNSVKLQIIDGGIQIAAKFFVTVPSVPLDVFVSLSPGSGTCCTAANASLFQETATCTMACGSARGDHVSVSFSMALSAKMYPTLNTTSGNITVAVPLPDFSVVLQPSDLGFQLSCNLASYPQLLANLYNNYVQPWGSLLNSKLTDAIKTTAEDLANSFSQSVGFASNMTNTTSVQLVMTSLNFVANSHIFFELEGYVKKARFNLLPQCPKIATTYVDDAVSDRDLPVPTDFDSFQETSLKGSYVLQTLVEGRLSRSALKAAMWSTLLDQPDLYQSLTSYSRTYGLLDARYDASLNWNMATFSFPIAKANNGSQPVSNTVRFTVQAGSSDLTCNNTGESQLAANFAKITLDLQPLVLGNFTDARKQSDPRFWVTGALVDWDVSHFDMNLTSPHRLSIPNQLIRILMAEFMKTKLPVANDLLKSQAPEIPLSLMQFIPGARMEVVHDYDNEGSDLENGYLVVSTRCACVTSQQFQNVVVRTRIGDEIMSKCDAPCSGVGRRRALALDNDDSSALPSTENVDDDLVLSSSMAISSRRHERDELPDRALATTTVQQSLNDFAFTGQCGDAPPNFDRLKQAATDLLTCAIAKDYTAIASTSYAKFACMKKLESGNVSSGLGACDPQSYHYTNFARCGVTMDVLLPGLFETECVEGPAFTCTESLQAIYSSLCTCARPGASMVLCDELFIPVFVVGVGIAIPLISGLAGLCYLSLCASEGTKQAAWFRVQRRVRDSWLIGLSFISSFVFSVAIIGWVLQDPFKSFAKTIIESDLFALSSSIETDFETFMVGWSMGFLFFMAFGSTQFFLLSLFSLYIGRCIWLSPMLRYRKDGDWFYPPDEFIKTWRQMYFVAVNAIRFIILCAICSLACPPLFFPFRLSVRVVQPQFEAGLLQQHNLAVNLTSVGTAETYINTAVSVVGYTLMSNAVGFISSGLVYVFHGGVPGCFTAGMVMIYLMNRKEERDRKQYEPVKHLLPPPDSSEMDRWRRIVYLFIWCTHVGGALGSSIAAILLYQVLRAPPAWAIFWLLCWVVPTPIIAFATSKRYKHHTGKFTVLYILIFAGFTTAMIGYAPADAAFITWLAVLLVVAIFCLLFLMLLSEFLNVTDRLESSKKLKIDIDRAMAMEKARTQQTVKPATAVKPRYQQQEHHRGIVANDGLVASGNPLFLQMEKEVVGSSGNATNNATLSDFERMKAMAKPSPTAPIVLRQQAVDSNAIGMAAERLQQRMNRMSVAIGPIDEAGAKPLPTLKSAMEAATKAYSKQKTPSSPEPSVGSTTPSPMPTVPELGPLTPAQQREKERIRRRISKRLAARGVDGDAAKELTERIANYHMMKTMYELQQQKAYRSSVAVNLQQRLRLQQQQQQYQQRPGASPQQRTAKSPSRPTSPSPSSPVSATKTSSPTMKQKLPPITASPPSPPSSPSRPQRLPSDASLVSLGLPQVKGKRPANAASPPSPPSQSRPQRQPSEGSLTSLGSPQMGVVHEKTKPLAHAQARDKTNNPVMDDYFARQFDPQYAYDGDDSFSSFIRAVVSQVWAWIKLQTGGFQCCGRRSARAATLQNSSTVVTARSGSAGNDEEEEGSIRATPNFAWPTVTTLAQPTSQKSFSAKKHGEHNGKTFSYGFSRFRSRIAKGFDKHFRPTLAVTWDILKETKENDDPRTYGLRVPGRRFMFVQGLLCMLIVLINIGFNRITVTQLKDEAIQLALSASPLQVPSSAYSWPGVQNVTEALDIPLGAYVDRATDAYILAWVVFLLWVLSLIVEILYSTFGRDMEEKRKGIKLARYISFANMPLLLVVVVLPCGPDYVSLSIGGVKKVVPECAPKLTSLTIGVASNLFGVAAGTYLTFQTMFVLLLIIPSVSRALFFVITREILDLRKLEIFEPRKEHTMTRKRLQNARFVWRILPFLHPILIYLPMLLVCQLIGKTYASVMAFLSMGIPLVTAQFQMHPKPEDQKVRDWFIYSTLWIIAYGAVIMIIVLVEAFDRGQVSYVMKATFESWTWYVTATAEVCLAIVVASDVLYLFMASDDELEADSVINEYLDAMEEEAGKVAEGTVGATSALLGSVGASSRSPVFPSLQQATARRRVGADIDV